MMKLSSFDERLEYLRLDKDKHVSPRSISNRFYKSPAWLQCRRDILRRDLGMPLGVMIHGLSGMDDKVLYVHHINPLTEEDIEEGSEKLFDPENLITVDHETHMAIHYGRPVEELVERKPGDTKLWGCS